MISEMIRKLIMNFDFDRWYCPSKLGKDCGLSDEQLASFANACRFAAGDAVNWNEDVFQIQGCNLYLAVLHWCRSVAAASQHSVDGFAESSLDRAIIDIAPLYCHIWSALLKREAKTSSSQEVRDVKQVS